MKWDKKKVFKKRKRRDYQFFLFKKDLFLIRFILDINLSPTSSPTKMSINSASDDSPKEDGKENLLIINLSNLKYLEHDWDSYLIETNSEAAPAVNFKQVK